MNLAIECSEYRVSQKKLTLLNSLPNKKFETFSYVWMAKGLIYHNDTKKSENKFCFGEHWPLVLRLWKLGCARIGCLFWLSKKSPNVEIDDGHLVNLWLIIIIIIIILILLSEMENVFAQLIVGPAATEQRQIDVALSLSNVERQTG